MRILFDFRKLGPLFPKIFHMLSRIDGLASQMKCASRLLHRHMLIPFIQSLPPLLSRLLGSAGPTWNLGILMAEMVVANVAAHVNHRHILEDKTPCHGTSPNACAPGHDCTRFHNSSGHNSQRKFLQHRGSASCRNQEDLARSPVEAAFRQAHNKASISKKSPSLCA